MIHAGSASQDATVNDDVRVLAVQRVLRAAASGQEARITTDASPVPVWVIPTNEELVIAIDTMKLALTAKQTPFV